MKHYPHHIGDFDRATRHLTRLERSVYRDLLDMYYDTESRLPPDIDYICRKIIARSNEERTAVEQVLNEFFNATDTGYWHERCESEIEAYRSHCSQKAQAGKASAAKKAAARQLALNGNPTAVERALNSVATGGNGKSTNHKPTTKNQVTEPTVLVDGKPPTPAGQLRVDCPYQKILEAWVDEVQSLALPKPVSEWAPPRKTAIRCRWQEKLKLGKYADEASGVAYWRRLFAFVEASDFLTGRVPGRAGSKPFRADIDWIFNPTNLQKIVEGKYVNDPEAVPA